MYSPLSRGRESEVKESSALDWGFSPCLTPDSEWLLATAGLPWLVTPSQVSAVTFTWPPHYVSVFSFFSKGAHVIEFRAHCQPRRSSSWDLNKTPSAKTISKGPIHRVKGWESNIFFWATRFHPSQWPRALSLGILLVKGAYDTCSERIAVIIRENRGFRSRAHGAGEPMEWQIAGTWFLKRWWKCSRVSGDVGTSHRMY